MTPKRSGPKTQTPALTEINKEKKGLNSSQSITESKMFYGNAMFIGNSQKEPRYLSSPVYRFHVWWIQN